MMRLIEWLYCGKKSPLELILWSSKSDRIIHAENYIF